MHNDARSEIVAELSKFPPDVRRAPARESELNSFEIAFGEIPADVRWFLQACGGGAVGREWLDSIRELPRSHTKYLKEFGPPLGWSMENVFIVGWDGGGNPIAVHRETGQVLIEDHDFGGIHVEATSFLQYLLRLLGRA